MARDLVIIAIVSIVVLLLGLRCLLAVVGIERWTAAWQIVDAPTGVLVAPLERIDSLAQTPVNDLSLATIVVTATGFVAALIALGTLANRRE